MKILTRGYIILLLLFCSCITSRHATTTSKDPFALFKSPIENADLHYIKKGSKEFIYLKGQNLKDYTVVTNDEGLSLNVKGHRINSELPSVDRSSYLNSLNTASTIDGSRIDINLKAKQGFKVYRRPSGIVLAMGHGYKEIADDELNALEAEILDPSAIDRELNALIAELESESKEAVEIDKGLDTLITELELEPKEVELEELVMEEEVIVKPARIKSIKFSKIDNRAQLVIRTNRPVEYEKKYLKEPYNQITIDMLNTYLPRKLRRPLDTTKFPGLVTMINPYQVKGPYKIARIVIQLRDGIEPQMVQKDNFIYADFPLLPEREEVAVVKVREYVPSEVDDIEAARQLSRMNFEDYLAKPTRFYGTRLSLKMADADIFDALRIIQEVSGINIIVSENIRDKKVNVSLKDVPWDQALSVVLQNAQLGYVRQGSVIRVASLSDLRDERKLAAEALEAHEALEPLRIMIAKLNYIKAKEAEDKIKTLLSKRGRVSVDRETNTLLIHDIEDVILKADRMIKAVDLKPTMVAIEARIIEANETWIRAMGFSWATNSGVIAFKNADGMGDISALIGAASVKGDVKIISAPRISTLDGQTASIVQGTQVAYKTSSYSSTGELIDKVEFENIEVALNVTPKVTSNNEIILDIDVKREFPDYTLKLSKGLPPGVGVRKASSKILLKNGDTTVIGGLYSLDVGDASAGVPVLKKIPIVGWFFGKSESKEIRSELLIFLKATIKEEKTLARM